MPSSDRKREESIRCGTVSYALEISDELVVSGEELGDGILEMRSP